MNIGAETEWIEFKKTTGELKEGIISIASMLNKNGYGTLYFGVKERVWNQRPDSSRLYAAVPGYQPTSGKAKSTSKLRSG